MKFPIQRYNMIDIIADGLKPVNDKSNNSNGFFMQIIWGLFRGSERVGWQGASKGKKSCAPNFDCFHIKQLFSKTTKCVG